MLQQVTVSGRKVLRDDIGVCTGVKLGGDWFTTRAGVPTPRVQIESNHVTLSDIRFGPSGTEISESWRFVVYPDRIVWRIERTYPCASTIEDSYFPGWEFQGLDTWTGGLVGHGGVAWSKLFDAPNAAYGIHNGKVTFWHKNSNSCLRIIPSSLTGGNIAVRFSRKPSGSFCLDYYVSDEVLQPRQGLSRFRRNTREIWRPFNVAAGKVGIEFTLSALDYDAAYDSGHLAGLDGAAIRELSHTIARIGAVDELIIGSNGYYSDVAVLHEPWLAQMGLLIDDADYTRALSDTLEFQRDHAIGPDGRVKSRWAGRPGDEMPGTYDTNGFYECQWGWLMDSQPCWVINVADQFDFNGDRSWLQRQKSACESVLAYLLKLDTDGNGLVKMMTDSHLEGKGSDWIDVAWAAYENALVNAQTFWALSRWADCEDVLGDKESAGRYRRAADKLKTRFNRDTADGGFWDAQNQCYAYWRNKDGSVHGTNLVIPVNFSALGYGLCDPSSRRDAILNRIESLMQKENLFFWPLCFFSFAKEEGHPEVNWPFPHYENGDLFLAWGELGTRAYAPEHPELALKYVTNVLAQYSRDGLAFQRYLRQTQTGQGNDILANNCSIVVGLYRNLYGIQPRYNRLYLEPHLTPELNGTRLNYELRGKHYQIELSVNDYAVTAGIFTVRSHQPFGVNVNAGNLQYFNGATPTPALTLNTAPGNKLELSIQAWSDPAGTWTWTESGVKPGLVSDHMISGLQAGARYKLSLNGKTKRSLSANSLGQVVWKSTFDKPGRQVFRLSLED